MRETMTKISTNVVFWEMCCAVPRGEKQQRDLSSCHSFLDSMLTFSDLKVRLVMGMEKNKAVLF